MATAFQAIGSTMAFVFLFGIGVYGCYQIWVVSKIVNIDRSDNLSLIVTCAFCVANLKSRYSSVCLYVCNLNNMLKTYV